MAALSQKEVAFLLNIKNIGRISEWEQGISNPSMENLFKLSIIYQTLPDMLYGILRKKLVQSIHIRIQLLTEKRVQERRLDKGG